MKTKDAAVITLAALPLVSALFVSRHLGYYKTPESEIGTVREIADTNKDGVPEYVVATVPSRWGGISYKTNPSEKEMEWYQKYFRNGKTKWWNIW